MRLGALHKINERRLHHALTLSGCDDGINVLPRIRRHSTSVTPRAPSDNPTRVPGGSVAPVPGAMTNSSPAGVSIVRGELIATDERASLESGSDGLSTVHRAHEKNPASSCLDQALNATGLERSMEPN